MKQCSVGGICNYFRFNNPNYFLFKWRIHLEEASNSIFLSLLQCMQVTHPSSVGIKCKATTEAISIVQLMLFSCLCCQLWIHSVQDPAHRRNSTDYNQVFLPLEFEHVLICRDNFKHFSKIVSTSKARGTMVIKIIWLVLITLYFNKL